VRKSLRPGTERLASGSLQEAVSSSRPHANPVCPAWIGGVLRREACCQVQHIATRAPLRECGQRGPEQSRSLGTGFRGCPALSSRFCGRAGRTRADATLRGLSSW
jgi:hypothetical protein